jgi:hypothetical protein
MAYRSSHFLHYSLLGLAGIFFIVGAVFPWARTNATGHGQQANESAGSGPGERQLGIGVKSHIPIKIKAKNINNEDWAHDLEIEVTNRSDKPIYFLSFILVIQGLRAEDGKDFAFWIHYGRARLNDLSTPLENTDVPLLPNETCALKIPEATATGWEKTRAKKNYPQPKKVGLVFQVLNFGDGTGFVDSGGTYVDIHKKLGENRNCLSPPGSILTANAYGFSFLPAAFLPVSFFKEQSQRWIGISLLDSCCGDGCDQLKSSVYTCTRVCDPENPEKPSAVTAPCGDPLASCRKLSQHYETCWSGDTPLSCSVTELYPCCLQCGPEGEGDTCHDGFDNDGDGFTDCAEPDCRISGGFYEAICDDNIDDDCDNQIDCADPDCDSDAGRGGNEDGRIDDRDAIFSSLRLWRDLNHNGISEAGELSSLPVLNVTALDLSYRESPKTDQFGNRFRYRSKVYNRGVSHVGRWAWDVFLQMGP